MMVITLVPGSWSDVSSDPRTVVATVGNLEVTIPDVQRQLNRISQQQSLPPALQANYAKQIAEQETRIAELLCKNNKQQADTGTKMIHVGKNTKSTIISKGISAGEGQNSYRGRVQMLPKATGSRNYTQCDSMLIGNKCGAHTFPYIEVANNSSTTEHEASTSKIGEDQIFYCKARGLNAEHAISLIVSGFCKEVFKELPMEFALEAQQLLGISLEGSVG